MIINPNTGLPVVSFTEMASDATAFRSLMARSRHPVVPGGPLDVALSVIEGLPSYAATSPDPAENVVREAFPQAIGLDYLARLLNQVSAFPGFAALIPHLRYVATAGSASALTAAASASQPRHHVFELLVAALGLKAGYTSTLAEPDVVLTRSSSWAIACKSINTDNPVTLADRVEEGIGQCLKSDADYFLGAVSVSNRLPHEPFLPLLDSVTGTWGSFRNATVPAELLRGAVTFITSALQAEAASRFLHGREARGFRGVLVLAQTVAAIEGKGACLTMPALVSRASLFGEPGLADMPEELLGRDLHWAAQAVLS